MAELDEIRWHCRRGLLELDLILEKFDQQYLESLNLEQLECFKDLLAFYDTDLLDLVKGRAAAPDRRYDGILQLLRTCTRARRPT